MPYVITAKRPCFEIEFEIERDRTEILSRRAVATHEAAQTELTGIVMRTPTDDAEALAMALRAIDVLPEEGGVIETPDGTVIEVEQVEWKALASGDPAYVTHSDDEIIDAYNARQ